MTTFDPTVPPGTHHDLSAPPSHIGMMDDPHLSPTSTLEDLRAAVERVDTVVEHEFIDHYLFSPGGIIRLTCETEVDHNAWKAIQIASMPPQYRKKRIPDPRKVDEAVAFAALIGAQTIEIAIRQDDDTYKPLVGTFEDVNVLAAFGVAEALLAVRAVFGKSDAYLLHAGRDLLEACGLGERRPGEPGDDGDPT